MQLPNAFAETFATTICKVCGLCLLENDAGDVDPGHCIVLFNNDKAAFMKIVEYLMKTRKADIQKYMDYLTFEGFSGLFCIPNDACPFLSAQCRDISQRLECYKTFIAQANLEVAPDQAIAIKSEFGDMDPREIGAEYKPGSIKLDKKEKKSVTRTLHRAMKAFMKKKKNKYAGRKPDQPRKEREKKVKKKVSTYFFYRDDDPVWAAKVRKILGIEEKEVGKT
jgi:hypothetical protein